MWFRTAVRPVCLWALLGPTCLGLVILGITGCGDPADRQVDPYAHIEGDGTEKMTAVLAEIYEKAQAEPFFYGYMNNAQAEHLRGLVHEASDDEVIFVRFNYAFQLLNAGRTHEALDEIHDIVSQLGVSPRSMNRSTKPLFDLMALAYMRLGEEENCIDNPSSERCIFPITKAGIHQHREGSEQAARLYEEMLRHFPRDLQARWLLNLAHMTLGDYPDGVPDRFRISGLNPPEQGLIPRFRDVAPEVGVAHEGLAGGVSVDDFNNNGLLDILVTSWGVSDQVRLYLSDGEGGFVDHTEEAGLMGIVGGLNTVHGDYNNSGYADIFILRGAWLGDAGEMPNSLLRNNGDGTFTDVTYESGLASYHPTQVAAWGDFNNNGLLDLFVGNESGIKYDFMTGEVDQEGKPRPSELYMNNDDGTFTEVAQQMGLDLDAYVKGAVWCDVNNSGLPDLFVSVMGGDNRLYINKGGTSIEDWHFEEQAREAGVVEPYFSFTTWCWDFNNDGYEDIFVSGYDLRRMQDTASDVAAEKMGLPVQGDLPRIYRNNGNGTFSEVSGPLDLNKIMYTMGANFGDLTGDGYLDFYVGTGAPDLRSLIPNRMFYNRRGQNFEEVTYEGGFGHLQKGHAIAFADFTRSGAQDIYAVMGGAVEGDVFQNALFENPGHTNAWINVRLEGRESNRSAIGARVRVDVTDARGASRSIHRTVTTGGSFGANPLELKIGLGDAERVDLLSVQWPDAGGSVQEFENVELNRYLHIVEGSEEPEYLERPHIPFRSTSEVERAHHDNHH